MNYELRQNSSKWKNKIKRGMYGTYVISGKRFARDTIIFDSCEFYIGPLTVNTKNLV
jgi:hypothetical protein